MIAFIHGFVCVCVCDILDCAIYYNDLLLKLVYLVQNGSLWERDRRNRQTQGQLWELCKQTEELAN